MPKESLVFTRFEGVIGAADAHDLPPGTAAYAENLDMVTQVGVFAALPADSESSTADAGLCAETAVATDLYASLQSVLLVDLPAAATEANIKVINTTSFAVAASSGLLGANSRAVIDTAVSDGNSMHVGLGATSTAKPKWVGVLQHTQFTGITTAAKAASPSSVSFYDAVIEPATYVGIHPTTTNITAELPSTVSTDEGYVAYDNSEVGLRNDTVYVYYASMTYDFFQEGPLRPILIVRLGKGEFLIRNEDTTITALASPVTADQYKDATAGPGFASQAAAGLKYLQMKLRVLWNTIPRRVTGINIYRGENPDLSGDLWDSALSTEDPLLIKQIDLTGTISVAASPTYDQWKNDLEQGEGTYTWADNSGGGTTYKYVYFWLRDDGSILGQTYGSRTGVTPALTTMQLHYGVSCVSQGYHIVSRCYHPSLGVVENWVFRSKPAQFDVFDWTTDYLKLPFRPNALVNYAGRVYAFGDRRTAVINPGTLDIEDEWEGVGVAHRKSVVTSDRGMFWADSSNIYHHDGTTVQRIGRTILRNQFDPNVSWLGLGRTNGTLTYTPCVGYDPLYDCVVVFCNAGTTTASIAWMYHVETQRWCLLTFPNLSAAPFISTFHRKDARLMYMTGSLTPGATTREIWALFGHATNLRPWRWVSAVIAEYATKTRLYEMYISYYNAFGLTVKVYANNTKYTAALESDNHFTVADWVLAIGETTLIKAVLTNTTGSLIYARSFALDVSATAGTTTTYYNVHQMEVVHRPLTAR